jgi:hypothetical protein
MPDITMCPSTELQCLKTELLQQSRLAELSPPSIDRVMVR